jgi:hypothetical protein
MQGSCTDGDVWCGTSRSTWGPHRGLVVRFAELQKATTQQLVVLQARRAYLKAAFLQCYDLARLRVARLVHLAVRALTELADALVTVVNHERPLGAVIPATNHSEAAKQLRISV